MDKNKEKILEDYIAEDSPKRALIAKPDNIKKSHELSKSEESNKSVSVYKNGVFVRQYDLQTKKKSDLSESRYISIDRTRYDMYDPQSIMQIPIPELQEYTYASIPYNFIRKYDSDDIPVYLSDQEVQILVDRAIDLAVQTSAGSLTDELKELLQDIFREETTDLSDEEIIDWIEEADSIIHSTPIEKNESFTASYNEDSNNSVNTLYEDDEEEISINVDLAIDLHKRVSHCFSKDLLLPLAYVAFNYTLRTRYYVGDCSRSIAQLIAFNEADYAAYLLNTFIKRGLIPSEKEKEIILEGNSLKSWVINTAEYMWIVDNLPDLVPKNKGSYTRAKNANSKVFQNLQKKAGELGYELKAAEKMTPEQVKLHMGKIKTPYQIKYYDYWVGFGYYDEKGKYKNTHDDHANLKKEYKTVFEKHKKEMIELARLTYGIENLDYNAPEMIDKALTILENDIISFYTKYTEFVNKVRNMLPEKIRIQKKVEINIPFDYPYCRNMAIILERSKRYEDLVHLCELAIENGLNEDGTKGKMEGRLLKAKKKMNK